MAVAITPELCVAGRELTEPKLDRDGRRLAFVSRQAGATSIQLIDLADPTALERQLTTFPAPAPGRGMYGGCFAWMPDGSGVVYCGPDGRLWRQPVTGGAADALTAGHDGRPVAAPAVAADGSFVVYIVDTAEVCLQPLDGRAVRRLDEGSHDFCADPATDPTGAFVSYQAWSVPDMPWDGAARITVAVDGTDVRTAWRPDGGAVQQPRFAPDGTPIHVHDGTGWLQVWWGERRLLADDECEHADASWGQGQVSFAVSPSGDRVAVARNERGFGRLSVVDVATGASTDVARGVHGQLSWRGERLAAVRSGARTPTQVVVYDTASWERRVLAVGPVVGWDGVDLIEPEAITLEHDDATLHARRYVSPASSGRLLMMLHGGPTGQWPVTLLPCVAPLLPCGWGVLLPYHRGLT
ncbi:MAG: TolB family protein, partial [Ilumatobacteraceae bacterium]